MTDTSINDQLQQFQAVYFPNEIIFNLILSFFLGLLISFVYKKTHKGMSYSQSFMVTNIFLSLIVCMVIMTIGNSISRAFALVGALSIIRFRTVIKDPKDIVFIFWSLATGMVCGTGQYFLAFASSLIITIVAYILHKSNYGSIYKSEFILQFRFEKTDDQEASYMKKLNNFCSVSTLLNSEPSGDNKSLKLTFDIVLKEEEDVNKFILDISGSKGVSEASIVAAQNDVDY
ncbi:DUF4956 domain-containing protein [Candidatus Pelagibacter sp.]|jgi:uncharacterized membrane protein YhiD involved in acid resistance|nr:DUF4956 domain-containing protein [Candidatus Pelagibacter sp.]